jgi:hypothetical protein
MRYLAICAAGLCLLATGATAGINAPSEQGMTRFEAQTPMHLAQAEKPKKDETVTQTVKRETKEVKAKVKRAWKKLTGYKFDVACPVLIPLSHKTCTETGKNRDDARAKCQSQNPLCSVSEIK